jgi:hypothetical protein
MLYFLKEETLHSTEGEYKRNSDWFIERDNIIYWIGIVSVNIGKDYLQKSINPEFPTETARLYRLRTTYPGSPKQNSLFMQSWKDSKKGTIGTYVWKGVWVELKWGDVRCANWENFEKVKFEILPR